MKKKNISIDSTYSSSHRHALSTFGFSFNATSTSCFDEWIIDSGEYYHMARENFIFSTLNECNTCYEENLSMAWGKPQQME
jgi:hypothetical protein